MIAPRLSFMVLIGLASALAGCGSLRVQVDIVDPEHVRAELADEALRKDYRKILMAQPGELSAAVERNFTAYQREVVGLAGRLSELADAFPADSPMRGALAAHAKSLAGAVANGGQLATASMRSGATIEDQGRELRDMKLSPPWTGRGSIPLEVRERLLSIAAEEKRQRTFQLIEVAEIRRDVVRFEATQKKAAEASTSTAAGAVAKLAQASTNVASQIAAVEAAARRSIIGGGELTNTEYAYIVARTPESLWVPKYNEALGAGFLGNVDVVIRMNTAADFSVKGMRFDASTVAQVASKVMTQSLLIGAQMAGVPVATASSGTSTGGDALSKQSADLATLEQTVAGREALTGAQRSAIRAAARSILGVLPALESGELKDKSKEYPGRRPLHQSVQSTVDALKPALTLQDLR